jgi:hypothetical protein
MCRVHEQDASGVVLIEDLGYEHLMLPMEFEPERTDEIPIEEDLIV